MFVILAIVILFFLMLLNGICAMSELAMMTSRQSRLQQAADRGSKGAAEALRLQAEPTRFLSTVQIAITLIGILAGAYGENSIATALERHLAAIPAVAKYADVLSLLIVVLGITYASLVIGELVPKRLALAFPETVASSISRPLSALSWVMALPVKVLTVSTELILKLLRVPPTREQDVSIDDVRDMASKAAALGAFGPAEYEILHRASRINEMTAESMMVPRRDVVWIDKNERGEMIRALVGANPYSHFPVCDGDLDKPVGVVHIKDMVAHGLLAGDQFDVASLAQPPVHVPEAMNAGKLLSTLRQARSHFAFVTDEYGGIAGVVTLNDFSEAVIGDVLRGTENADEQLVTRADGSLLIDGRYGAPDLLNALSVPSDAVDDLGGVATTGGVVMHLLGHLPKVGELVEWRGWRFEVVDMDNTRVDRIIATRLLPPPTPEATPAN
jgi:putative hemolysin